MAKKVQEKQLITITGLTAYHFFIFNLKVVGDDVIVMVSRITIPISFKEISNPTKSKIQCR